MTCSEFTGRYGFRHEFNSDLTERLSIGARIGDHNASELSYRTLKARRANCPLATVAVQNQSKAAGSKRGASLRRLSHGR
jgi:hypothetical protein